MKKVDVLVIGAGPSGTIAAALLKKAGLEVMIVEKLLFPRFVIGESLLPRCMEALEEADLLDAVRSRGYQEKFGAKFVHQDGRVFDINFSEAHTSGWTWTWQVPRDDFDLTLATACQQKGIPVHFETEVIDIQIQADESSRTLVRFSDGSEKWIEARYIVDGSGYGRVIPKMFGLEKESQLPARQALFTHFEDNRRTLVQQEPNRITIYIYDQKTWIWCIPFSNGFTSLGFVGSPDFFAGLQGSETEKFRHLVSLHPELSERFSLSPMRFEPRTLKSWSVTTDRFYGPGYVLTGNVTEFLDPVFSSGVTLASVTAQNAARLVIRKLQGESVDWENEYMKPCTRGVDVFRTFVNSWYNGDLPTIFFSQDQNSDMRRQISSVLAGYVWDESNQFVRQHEKYVGKLAQFLKTREFFL